MVSLERDWKAARGLGCPRGVTARFVSRPPVDVFFGRINPFLHKAFHQRIWVVPGKGFTLVPTVLRGNAVPDAPRRPAPEKQRTQSVQDFIPTEDRGNE